MLIPAPWRPRLEFAAKAFLNVACASVLVAGTVRLHDRALASSEHRIDLGRWTVLDRPDWATLDDVRAIRAQSGLSGFTMPLLDRSVGESVEACLRRPPNVRRVAGLRRTHPNQLEAVIELRKPVAAVRIAGKPEKFVEVDEQATALSRPLDTRPIRAGRPLRLILGATGAVQEPGRRFGPDVAAAASLASDLDDFSDEKGRASLAALDRIDVANWAGRAKPGTSEVALTMSPAVPPAASSRCVVEWGRAGTRAAPGEEMPFDAKASRLLQALRLFPRLDGLRTVRVAFDDLVVVPESSTPPAQLTKALSIDGDVQAK